MNDKISIIIVNYNGWKDTIECLKSLEQVKYDLFEVVLVDNASTDESVKELRKFKKKSNLKIKLLLENNNGGFAAGNNTGIKYALATDSQYFLMLNNDTLVDQNFLEELLLPFVDSEVGATIGQIYYAGNRQMIWYAGGNVNEKYMKPSHFRFNEVEQMHISEQKEVSFATGCCICCSRKCIEKVGLWDEIYFLYEEDVDLSIRIRRSGFKIIYNSDSIIFHKVSASTSKISGGAQYYQIRNRLLIIKKFLKGSRKITAYIYTILMGLNRVRKKEYKMDPLLEAVRAFNNNEKGKRAER